MNELQPCPFCGGKAKYESALNIIPLIDENGAYVDYDRCYECYEDDYFEWKYLNTPELKKIIGE